MLTSGVIRSSSSPWPALVVKVLKALFNAGFRVKKETCHFDRAQTVFLDYVIEKDVICLLPKEVRAIHN